MKFNALIVGDIGTGKTSSLRTVVEAGHPLYVLATEPGIETILPHGDNCHYCTVTPATTELSSLIAMTELTGKLSQDAMQKLTSPQKMNYQQLLTAMRVCENFVCDECKQSFGPIDALPANAVFAIDGLSGLSKMAKDIVIGGKPIATLPEWQISQNTLESWIVWLTGKLTCSFVLIAHLEQEQDEVSGAIKLMPSTLGRKLAPRLLRPFDEVIMAGRRGERFYWSTADGSTQVKSRLLGLSDNLKPSFAPMLEATAPRPRRIVT